MNSVKATLEKLGKAVAGWGRQTAGRGRLRVKAMATVMAVDQCIHPKEHAESMALALLAARAQCQQQYTKQKHDAWVRAHLRGSLGWWLQWRWRWWQHCRQPASWSAALRGATSIQIV